MKTYGILNLTDASPAQSFTEPILLEDVKSYLRVTSEDEDDFIAGLISAARTVAENKQGKDLVVKQQDLTLDGFLDVEIKLRDPLQSVDLVRYRDIDGNYTTLTAETDYIVDTVRGIVTPPPNTTWPNFDAWPSGSVLVRFTSGYSATHQFWSGEGKRIQAAMLMLIAQWYEDRKVASVTGQPYEMPYGVGALLDMGASRSVK